MDTVTGIMRELSSFSQTLKSRAEQITDIPQRLEEKGLAVVHHSISQLRKFSAVDAEVLKHTATTGHFSDAAKEALMATIDAKSLHMPTHQTQMLCKPQHVANLQLYLTGEDLACVADLKLSINHRMLRIAQRCVKLGVKSMSEKTIALAIGILLRQLHIHDTEMPSSAIVYDMVQTFKRMYDKLRQGVISSNLLHYPLNPVDLPQELFTRAYPDKDDPPANQVTVLIFRSEHDLL